MKSEIDGVIIKKLSRQKDERGWLAELFRSDEIPPEFRPVMAYMSITHPGVVRGPHEHVHQADLFCFLGPSDFKIYLWDNRPGSASHGRKVVFEAGQKNPLLLIIPPGIVHAYKNIGECDGLVFNAPNRLFKGSGRSDAIDEIRHEENQDSPFKLTD